MLLSGIGISVHEFLESRRAPERAVQSVPSVLQECTRDEARCPRASKPTAGTTTQDPAPSTGVRIGPPAISPPATGPAASSPAAAPTGWMPESDTSIGPSARD
jgi:hypothetical protein